ncbi:hypothetical protein GALL_465970 [mine drainage metagenome]|uniref:Uncharacterized protein n=1 Tax=mine drainage metagenome TaxID=410659 RepID=A0A1J5PW60_9ZZZZ
MPAQRGQGTVLVVNIARDIQTAIDADRSVIANLQRRSAGMDKPQLAAGGGWGHLLAGKQATDDNALFDVALLGNQGDLIAGRGRTDHTPTAANPLG